MNNPQKHKILQSVMWDYSITPAEVDMLLEGKIDKAGHYTRTMLLTKLLTSLPWYTIIQIIPAENIKEMLTDEVIGELWPESVKKHYEYIRKRLQETLPAAG